MKEKEPHFTEKHYTWREVEEVIEVATKPWEQEVHALRSALRICENELNRLKQPRKRGRPKELKIDLFKVLRVKKKAGRKKIHKDPLRKLEDWDRWREQLAHKSGKRKVGDKELRDFFFVQIRKNKSLGRDEISKKEKQLRSYVKQWRDITKKRMQSRRKAENAPK